MYRVTIFENENDSSGIQIHSPYSDGLKIKSDSLKPSINAIGTFTFTIYPNSPGWRKIKPLKTLIKVEDTKHQFTIFEGRVLIPTSNQGQDGILSESYLCEDEKAYLHDSIQSFKKFTGNQTGEQLFREAIRVHNEQVEEYKRFTVGIVDIPELSNHVRFIDDTQKTFDTITEKLLSNDSIGGELRVRKENGVRYIDWVRKIGEEKDTPISLQKNLLEMTKEIDPTSVVTVLYPRGQTVETEGNDDVSRPRLTIASVNNNKEYLLAKQELIDEFGYQAEAITWDDITQASNLKTTGQNWLDNQLIATGKFTIRALDLSLLNIDPHRYWIGNTHLVVNPLMNVNEKLRIIDMNININAPEQTELAFGEKQMTLSEYQSQNKKNIQKIAVLENDLARQKRLLAAEKERLNNLQNSVSDDVVILNTINDDLVSRIKKIEGGISPEEPNVFPKEVRSIFRNDLARIKSRLLESDFNLALGTDFHCDQTQTSSYGVNTKNAYSHLANLMYFSDKVDTTIINGDNFHSFYPELADIKSEYTDLVNAMTSRTYASDVFIHIGNHDDGSSRPDLNENNVHVTDGFIKDSEFRTLLQTSERKFGETRNNGDSLYYYKDYPDKKIRLIGLNTSDINETMTNAEGYLKYRRLNLHTIRQAQLDWLANVALRNVSADYHTLIVAHCPLRESWINRPEYINQNIVQQVLKAFKTGGTCNASSSNPDFPLTANYDFTDQGSRNFIAWFSGHTHREADNDWDGIKIVECLHSVGDAGNQQNVVTEDAQTIVSIDTINRVIKLRGFGRATDRVINY